MKTPLSFFDTFKNSFNSVKKSRVMGKREKKNPINKASSREEKKASVKSK